MVLLFFHFAVVLSIQTSHQNFYDISVTSTIKWNPFLEQHDLRPIFWSHITFMTFLLLSQWGKTLFWRSMSCDLFSDYMFGHRKPSFVTSGTSNALVCTKRACAISFKVLFTRTCASAHRMFACAHARSQLIHWLLKICTYYFRCHGTTLWLSSILFPLVSSNFKISFNFQTVCSVELIDS